MHPNENNPYQQQDPNAQQQQPLTRQQQPQVDVRQMQAAAGQAVSWFNQLTKYVEENPGIAIAVGAGILLMGLCQGQGQQDKD